jgi:hypothetical protein
MIGTKSYFGQVLVDWPTLLIQLVGGACAGRILQICRVAIPIQRSHDRDQIIFRSKVVALSCPIDPVEGVGLEPCDKYPEIGPPFLFKGLIIGTKSHFGQMLVL